MSEQRRYWSLKLLSICGIFLVGFVLPYLRPGSPAALYENNPANPRQRTRLVAEYGFDRSLPAQYVIWLQRIVTGQWGHSRYHNRPVFPDILRAAGVTLLLLLWTMLAFGVWTVILWGRHRLFAPTRSPHQTDTCLIVVEALPNFIVAIILHDVAIWQLGWLNIVNIPLFDPYYLLNPLHMLLPALALAITPLLVWRISKNVGVRLQDSAPRADLRRLRRQRFCALLRPLLAGFLLEVFLTEQIFSLPGLGRLGIGALKRRDFAALQGFILSTGTLYFVVLLALDLGSGLRRKHLVALEHNPTLAPRANGSRHNMYSSTWSFLALLALAVCAPQILPYDPTEIHSSDQLLLPGYRYILGTDFLGRDVLSRAMEGFHHSVLRAILITALAGGLSWLLLGLAHILPRPLRLLGSGGFALFDALPPFLLAFAVFLAVEHRPWPLETALIIACLPAARRLIALETSRMQRLAKLGQLSGLVLLLEVIFFFLNISVEPLSPNWGSDIRLGMSYSHVNIWLILSPSIGIVCSRYILHQLSAYFSITGQRSLNYDRGERG